MKPIKLFALVLVSVIFGANLTYAQNTIFSQIITTDGLSRDYSIYIPASYDSTISYPLIFNFHGYNSNYLEQEVYGDFRPIADTAGFLIVHPNGSTDNFGNSSWNTFDNGTVNDVAFISELLDTLIATYNIDTNSVYSTGMSNGGFMSYELACQLSQRIAAIASVTGSMLPSHIAACNCQHPMPVMQIHGTADGTVPYNGNILFEPIESLVNYWVQFNNCDTLPIYNQVPNTVLTDLCTAEHYVYMNGNNGTEVEFYKIIDGGHSWPGAPVNINVTNMDFSASTEIWRFFRKYHLNNIVTEAKAKEKSFKFSVYPNPSNGAVNMLFDDNNLKSVVIKDALGRVIHTIELYSNQYQYQLPNIGLYFITVISNTETITTKVINR
ncbi:MAG: T9SS type A sorting domain-containing protein [Bacteroidia bacterium]|nr:T9SS type A sorting domain-containing protein [Bacteroidia bacterium]MCZ2248654.1 T9SS type A sorting domain-containing protein [Bacteroidia bacterium]